MLLVFYLLINFYIIKHNFMKLYPINSLTILKLFCYIHNFYKDQYNINKHVNNLIMKH